MNNEMCGCGTEEKTSSAIGLVKINYKQDFELVVELLAGDKPYKLGDEDFRIDFIVMASRYTVGRTAGVCERCSVDGNKIRCFMDAHGLPPGELRAEVKVNTPDPNYADGSRLSVAIAEGVVLLVKDNTRFDGAVIKANIPVVLIDAYQLAKTHGYKGTIDEYYSTFNDVSALLESVRGMAEEERKRSTAETERAKEEKKRNSTEQARNKNEQQRQTNEQARKQAENERVSAESNRASAEVERAKAEQQRSSTDELWKAAEQQRIQAETQRQTAEEERKQAEEDRQKNSDRFNAAEEERKQAEADRQKNRDKFNAAEDARVTAEKQRNDTELARKSSEQQRQTNEDARNKAETERQTAENERATAEGKRADTDKERDQLVAKMQAAWQEIERMKKVREGEYGKEIELVEKIKNAAKIPTQNVWLDATDGEIKSTPASEGINANAYKYYYIGRREVVGDSGRCGNKYLHSLDLSNWETSRMTDANSMFRECSSLQLIDVSNWNTQALVGAGCMFYQCSSLQSLDVSNWNTQALTNGYYMFAQCSSLQSLDVSKWNTQALTNAIGMFAESSSLQKIDFRKANFNKVRSAEVMFARCYALVELWLPMTFDLLTSLDLVIPSWGATPEGLASLRWTFGEGADDRTVKGLQPCTVRLDAKVYDRLTDNERAAAAKKGWTITK